MEKLRYIHRNPVKRGLVVRPEDWAWSSFRHYLSGDPGAVEIESQWTARKRERAGIFPTVRARAALWGRCCCNEEWSTLTPVTLHSASCPLILVSHSWKPTVRSGMKASPARTCHHRKTRFCLRDHARGKDHCQASRQSALGTN